MNLIEINYQLVITTFISVFLVVYNLLNNYGDYVSMFLTGLVTGSVIGLCLTFQIEVKKKEPVEEEPEIKVEFVKEMFE